MLPSKSFNSVILILAGMVVAFICVSFVLYPILTPTPLTMSPHIARANCPRPVTSGGPELVIFIPTPVEWSYRRQLVLKQFRREMHLFRNAHLIFVVGTREGGLLEFEIPGITGMHHEIAMQTQVPHIQYLLTKCRDMGDEPRNANGTSSTTCKVYEALRHITTVYEKTPPRFVWRGADDAYLDLGVFRKYVMPALQTCRIFAGRVRFPTVGDDHDLELSTDHPELYSLYGLEKFGKYLVGMSFYMSWDVARYLGNGQIGPSDPLNPLAHCHGCQRSTHWDKALMVPIPSHPYSSPVCRQEVVASASQLTIDAKSTTSAIVDLVLDSKSGLPGTAVGAGLGSTWLKRLEHMAPSIACHCRSQTLNEE